MNQLNTVLTNRLKSKGLALFDIPWFLRDVINAISDNTQRSLTEMNGQLHQLGWDGIDIDSHTMELITASFESEDLKATANEPAGQLRGA